MYNYPISVINLLNELNDNLQTILPFSALFLLGSAARNELSYIYNVDGLLELFSDLEFLAVTPTRPTLKQQQELQNFIASRERQFANPNPLFHIDLIARERTRLRSFPPIIFTYEMCQNARFLYGEDLHTEFPEVTLANLNLRNTREILYKRLWAMLLYLPKRFILQQMSKTEARVAGYVLCRNALDLTTVLLPHMGVLLPSYQKRVIYLQTHFSTLPSLQQLGTDFPEFLQTCLKRRIDLDFSGMDLYAYYARVIAYLEKSFHVLQSELVDLNTLPSYSPTLYNEWPISRGEWYNLARLTLQWTRKRGPHQALNWLRLPKKGWLTVGLFAMHNALLSWLFEDVYTAEQYLTQATDTLRSLHFTSIATPSTSFIDRWLIIRTAWGEFWREYIRLGAVSYIQRFKYIMEWTHE